MSKECVFCRIAQKEIPADIVYQDEQVVVFRDSNPQAPIHLLLIPRKHIPSVRDSAPEDVHLVGTMLARVPLLSKQMGIDERGIRLVINDGPEAGQSVFHIHCHLLAGRTFRWPPG